MPYQRYQRIESLIKEELNKIILKELEFPGALVTITEVEAQKDLEDADVFISVLPSEKTAEVMGELKKNQRQLQHWLLKKINIKPMPKIIFKIDYGMEKAAEVEKAFIKIEKKEKEL